MAVRLAELARGLMTEHTQDKDKTINTLERRGRQFNSVKNNQLG